MTLAYVEMSAESNLKMGVLGTAGVADSAVVADRLVPLDGPDGGLGSTRNSFVRDLIAGGMSGIIAKTIGKTAVCHYLRFVSMLSATPFRCFSHRCAYRPCKAAHSDPAHQQQSGCQVPQPS